MIPTLSLKAKVLSSFIKVLISAVLLKLSRPLFLSVYPFYYFGFPTLTRPVDLDNHFGSSIYLEITKDIPAARSHPFDIVDQIDSSDYRFGRHAYPSFQASLQPIVHDNANMNAWKTLPGNHQAAHTKVRSSLQLNTNPDCKVSIY